MIATVASSHVRDRTIDEATPDTPSPPEPRERFDPGEWPKTLFICAATAAFCQEILDYIDVAIDDVRSKVRVVFCTTPESFDTQMVPVLTAGVSRIAGICIRHHNLDSDGFFEVLARLLLRLLWTSEPDTRSARELLLTLITCSYSTDMKLSYSSQRKFTDAFLDLYIKCKWEAHDLEHIFSDQRMVDLMNVKFWSMIRLIIGARIRGEL